jgi:quinol monooxygenase YgiN
LYVFCYDNNDPDTIHLFEVYNDPAELDENARSDWFAAYMEEVGPLLDVMPEIHMTTQAKGATV